MSSGAGRNGSIAESTPDVGADSGISISISGGYGVNNTLNLGNTYGSLTAPAITTSNKSVLKFVNNQPKTFSVTIENTTGTDFVLEKIYYDWGLPNANAGETLTLRTADDTVVLTHTVATAVGTYDIDKDIEDLTIAANSTLTLTGTVTGFANNGPQSRLDNLLFEGTYAASGGSDNSLPSYALGTASWTVAADAANAVALQIDSQAAQEVTANVTIAGNNNKRGAAMGAGQSGTWETFLNALDPAWHYSWNWEVLSSHPDDVEFVPQLFGAGAVTVSNLQNIIDGIGADDVDYIIGFNEPDLSSQGNTTVDEALTAWGVMEQALKDASVFDQVELVSPVVAAQYDDWLLQFLAEATVQGYTIDHVCMHKYVSHTNADTFYNGLKERYHREVTTSIPYAKVSEDPAFTDNKFIPFATNQVAGSETAQTFEFVVEGVVPAGATYQIKKTTNAAGTAWNTATFDLVPGTTTRTVAAPGGGFTRKVNVVFSSGDVYISSFKHNGVEQLTTTSQITHSLSDYGPIWLKEFAVKRTEAMIDNGENFPAADVSAFMENLLRKLNTDPEVFRYAWFNSNDPTSEYYPRQVDSLIFDINSLQTTALGDYYKTVNGPSYEVKESTTVDALAGSSTVSAVATNNHSTWTHKVSVASGTGSGAEQVIELDVVSLPTGGANYRIVKTNLNGNNVFGTAKPLTTGLNTITVTGTAFERTVTLQFNSGDITISGCSINGVELLNKAFGNINNGPLTISIPDSDYARSLNVEFSSSSIEVDSFKLNNNELTAIAVEGYYPLYDTETAANFVGDGTSHTHTLGGVTYYMPDGLTLGETMFHGNYTGE